MDKKFYGIFIGILIVVAGGIYWAASLQSSGGGAESVGTINERVAFAQCLSEEGATFYGAWWCPHCARQKALFGEKAMKFIDYVECALLNKKMNTTCEAKGIKSYPTWIFADGSRVEGEQTFARLAEKTGCPIPGGEEKGLPTNTSETSTSTEVK